MINKLDISAKKSGKSSDNTGLS